MPDYSGSYGHCASSAVVFGVSWIQATLEPVCDQISYQDPSLCKPGTQQGRELLLGRCSSLRSQGGCRSWAAAIGHACRGSCSCLCWRSWLRRCPNLWLGKVGGPAFLLAICRSYAWRRGCAACVHAFRFTGTTVSCSYTAEKAAPLCCCRGGCMCTAKIQARHLLTSIIRYCPDMQDIVLPVDESDVRRSSADPGWRGLSRPWPWHLSCICWSVFWHLHGQR